MRCPKCKQDSMWFYRSGELYEQYGYGAYHCSKCGFHAFVPAAIKMTTGEYLRSIPGKPKIDDNPSLSFDITNDE